MPDKDIRKIVEETPDRPGFTFFCQHAITHDED